MSQVKVSGDFPDVSSEDTISLSLYPAGSPDEIEFVLQAEHRPGRASVADEEHGQATVLQDLVLRITPTRSHEKPWLAQTGGHNGLGLPLWIFEKGRFLDVWCSVFCLLFLVAISYLSYLGGF